MDLSQRIAAVRDQLAALEALPAAYEAYESARKARKARHNDYAFAVINATLLSRQVEVTQEYDDDFRAVAAQWYALRLLQARAKVGTRGPGSLPLPAPPVYAALHPRPAGMPPPPEPCRYTGPIPVPPRDPRSAG